MRRPLLALCRLLSARSSSIIPTKFRKRASNSQSKATKTKKSQSKAKRNKSIMTWSAFLVAMRKGASDRTTSATRRAAVQQRALGKNRPLSTQTQPTVTEAKQGMEYWDNYILDVSGLVPKSFYTSRQLALTFVLYSQEYGEPWAVEERQLPRVFGRNGPLTTQQTQPTVTEALDVSGPCTHTFEVICFVFPLSLTYLLYYSHRNMENPGCTSAGQPQQMAKDPAKEAHFLRQRGRILKIQNAPDDHHNQHNRQNDSSIRSCVDAVSCLLALLVIGKSLSTILPFQRRNSPRILVGLISRYGNGVLFLHQKTLRSDVHKK